MEKRKNILEKLGSLIPGYSGYAERDGKRTADKVLRTGIADKLEATEKALYTRMNNAILQKDKEGMHTLESCRKEVNTLCSKIRHAPYGETSIFADVKIKEAELDRIHELDLGLLEAARSLEEGAEDAGMVELDELIKRVASGLEERENYLNKF